MNKKFIWILIIVLIVIAIFVKGFSGDTKKKEFKPIDKNIGDEFTELSYSNPMYIINYAVADVNGDTSEDMILLIGEKNNQEDTLSNEIINNMDVVLYDTANATFLKADAKKMMGKNNKIVMGDFTGDKRLDIMIVSEDDSKTNIRIFSYDNGKLVEIWKERSNKGLVFIGKFLDGWKAQIINKKLNMEQTLELVDRKNNYIAASFYDDSGKLLKEGSGMTTSGFISVEMVQLNDREGIRTVQRICGMNEMDILDEIETVWKYQDGKWQMVEVKGLKLGNLLY